MKTKSRTLPIGTISEGTLRPEDLILAYLGALDGIRLSAHDRKQVQSIEREFNLEIRDDAEADLVEELANIMENYLPNYCYFGSLEGDGACFGVWTDFARGVEDGEIVKVNAGDSFPAGADHVLSVTDHGNGTLYRRAGRRWIEVWSVV